MYKIPATTLFLGKNLIFVPECRSTSDYLLQLCQQKPLPEGTLVITSHQTAGRGQRGNAWEAQPGKNLTFSFTLKPDFLPVAQQFHLTMLVSLGICDLLTEETGTKVHIKWPNDILVDEKKICGILIENQVKGHRLSTSVTGIGLNVNQLLFSVPTAVSMAMLTGRDYVLPDVLDRLLKKIEVRYLNLRMKGPADLKDDYLQALYLRDQVHTFQSSDRTFQGIIRGIDEIGRLRIEVEDQREVTTFDVKEIRYGLTG